MAYAQEKQEYIVLANGDKHEAQIKIIKPKYIVAKVGPVEREYRAEMLQSFYSKNFNTVFETHQIGKRKKTRLLGIYRDGEVIVLCELKNMNTWANGKNLFGFMSTQRNSSTFWALEGKPYFRHKDEIGDGIHEVNKKELLNIKLYECFALMVKLVNELNDLDLTYNIKNQTYRDLLVKYNCECEAKIRVKEEEKEKEQK